MKYLKLLALCLLPISFAACSDDEEMNSGNATVGFASPEMSVAENTSMINVPIVVEGEHTGLIKVNVELIDAKGTSVTKDESVILTGSNIVMPIDVQTVYAEVRTLVNTTTDDFDRSFTLQITSAEGASISTASCKVNIEELIDPYEKLLGNYTFNAIDLTDGSSVTFNVELTQGAPQRSYTVEGFDGYLLGVGVTGREFWTLEYNAETESLTAVKGDYYAKNVNFGFLANCCVTPMKFNEAGDDVEPTTAWDATWDEGYTTITFDEDAILGIGLYSSNGQYAGWAGAYGNITLTKK